MRTSPAGVPHALCVKQQDEVDIAGIIELARAELAHAENQEPASLLNVAIIGQRDLAGGGVAQQMAGRRAERRVGEVAERGGDALERPQPGDVGETDKQCRAALGDAQLAHQGIGVGVLLVVPRTASPVERFQELGEGGVRSALQHEPQEAAFVQATLRQEGRVAEHCGKQCPAGCVVGQSTRKGGQFGVMIGLEPAFQPARGLFAVARRGQGFNVKSIGEQR